MGIYRSLDEIWTTLRSGPKAERYDAATTLASFFSGSDAPSGLERPPWQDVLRALLTADKECIGVADLFWSKVQFDCPDYAPVGNWMFAVLSQRGPRRGRELPEGVGNDLEFHAHEALDHDPKALRALLEMGFYDVVAEALDHGSLDKADSKTLCEALIATRDDGAVAGGVLGLLFGHGVVHHEGLDRGIFREHKHKNGKAALSVDYTKAKRGLHLFLYSRAKDVRLSGQELKEILEGVLPIASRGAEIPRAAAEKDPKFWLVPSFPAEVETKFYANGYVVSVFDFSKAMPSIRVDLPKEI